MRYVVLVDGEHHPPLVAEAIAGLSAGGHVVAAAVYCGGGEKVRPDELDDAYGVPLVRGDSAGSALRRALDAFTPDAIIDLSDEPAVSAGERLALASEALARGVDFNGPDFTLTAPRLEPVLTKPAVRVVATGKRTGKTAVSSALARHAVAAGFRPVIVAMGRGGPEQPRVVEAGSVLDAAELLRLADEGLHAASDYLEDAVTARVTTIGCRRVGGGLAGVPFSTNVVEGARMAEERPENLVVLEGSGSAIPTVAAHAGCLCVPADAEGLDEHLGRLRLLLADVAVVTMAEDEGRSGLTESVLRDISPHVDIVRAVLRPRPLSSVEGRVVFVCTTARPAVGPLIARHLEDAHGCTVAGMSHALADRVALHGDMEAAPRHEVLLTELKGAAVDVAIRHALGAGRGAVLMDNEPSGPELAGAFDRLLELAVLRAAETTTT